MRSIVFRQMPLVVHVAHALARELERMSAIIDSLPEAVLVAIRAEGWHVHDKLKEWGHDPRMLDTTRIGRSASGSTSARTTQSTWRPSPTQSTANGFPRRTCCRQSDEHSAPSSAFVVRSSRRVHNTSPRFEDSPAPLAFLLPTCEPRELYEAIGGDNSGRRHTPSR